MAAFKSISSIHPACAGKGKLHDTLISLFQPRIVLSPNKTLPYLLGLGEDSVKL